MPIFITKNGQTYDPTGDGINMAFLNTIRQPVNTDWHQGSWESAGNSYFALCLIGPGGTVQLTPGTWQVYVQILDNPEQPVKYCGVITVL